MPSLTERYVRSVEYLARAEAVIPLGSQTFSKSRTQYPAGAAPLFAQRSFGSRTWDIDGNEYVDLVSSLGAVALGYGDEEIHEAVVKQLKDGVTLSLAHPIEAEVAERLVDLIPCAEKVRFAKNGSDATSAAIRLARAFTGKEHVIVCGYHGWQDWYIGSTTMHRGVPNSIRALTHSITYNDIDALITVADRLQGNVAALIMEPMTSSFPDPHYLREVRRITQERGIVLVFDEMLTGFRFAPGGAQEYFGVTPDLAAFGKALANGFPLSAIVGRADILNVMPDIFFSGTFGGETLSLTAANVVLQRMATGVPTNQLASIGKSLIERIDATRSEVSKPVLTFSGHDSWIFQQWHIDDSEVLAQAKTLFLQEMLRRGVLVLNTHDVTTAFKAEDIEVVAIAYAESLNEVCSGLTGRDLLSRLECEPIRPLFRVRS
ncbi:MAG: aminotransferase class III-fold pyridoxal phosphate-dependent enzyme [Candidatus Nanopelagicales bacterium]|nr:aminotransferase class III-fold pyridoxal phosphate-dependent enzyme [Candidatus Nanopelagicales bacterium]